MEGRSERRKGVEREGAEREGVEGEREVEGGREGKGKLKS